jgi:GntR family transcriptional repressor for pyruvate dehydrogenase complex
MDYKQVKPLKGSEMVMNQLKENILSGKLPRGSRIASVVDLAVNFGVGRSTVREALSALKAMGWIEIQQGGGTFVSKELPEENGIISMNLFQSAESLKEVLEVRKVLETGCASMAARKRTGSDLRELERILLHMHDYLPDEEQGEQADVLFHLQIAKSTHNTLLLQMMESLSQRMQDSMKESRKLWFYGERATAQRLYEEHTAIYTAIKDQDETQAFERMMQHILKVEFVVETVFTGHIPIG